MRVKIFEPTLEGAIHSKGYNKLRPFILPVAHYTQQITALKHKATLLLTFAARSLEHRLISSPVRVIIQVVGSFFALISSPHPVSVP